MEDWKKKTLCMGCFCVGRRRKIIVVRKPKKYTKKLNLN
jgi:hypothetical protein